MKVLCCALAFAVTCIVRPAGAEEAKLLSYAIECQMVTVPGKLLPPLVRALTDDARAKEGHELLQKMLAQGDAVLEGLLVAQSCNNEKEWIGFVSAESLEEIVFPTDYEPPDLPSTASFVPLAPEKLKHWPWIGVMPTAFDSRGIGQTLAAEVDRTLHPRKFLCQCSVNHTRLERMEKIPVGREATGEQLFLEQPHFSVMKDRTVVTLEGGVPKLLGVHKIPGPGGVFELFVLTLTIHESKKA